MNRREKFRFAVLCWLLFLAAEVVLALLGWLTWLIFIKH